MSESTAADKSGKGEIKIKSTVEFFRTPNNSFRAEICEINGFPYVGIVKFWKPDNFDHFIPTKKSIFLTLEQWRSLGAAASGINKTIATLASDGLGIDKILIKVICYCS